MIKHIIKINTDPSYNRTIYSDMAIKNDHITITLTAGWPLDTNKALGGDSESRYLYGAFRVTGATDIRTDNDCGSTIDPDRTLSGYLGPDITMAQGANRSSILSSMLSPLPLQICLSPKDMNHSDSLSHILLYIFSP